MNRIRTPVESEVSSMTKFTLNGCTQAFESMLSLIAPATCVACDSVVFEPKRSGSVFCDACAPLVERETLGPAVFRYLGPAADAVRRFKYGGRSDLSVPLARAMTTLACDRFGGTIDAVVPIPLHPRKLRKRGYNQSALLARPIAKRLAVPIEWHALKRTCDLPPQAGGSGLDRRARSGLFRGHRPSASILLVDDVITTGATLNDAERALYAAGALRVCRIALCRTP
ncbi:MAG: ComF family protein [Myxococcota bacterium]